MINEQLVDLIRAGESGYMLQLWKQNKGFIHMMANKYVGGAERDDLEQEGYIALYEAVENYDQDKGMSFINYATFYIHRRMQMCVDNNRPVRLGYNMGALVRKRKKDSQSVRFHLWRRAYRQGNAVLSRRYRGNA